jgi:hypothetical protein
MKIKQMKINAKIKWMAVLLVLAVSCKREKVVSPQYAQAYTRFVIIDAPGSGKVQFYLDGKVNANGDSAIHNPDGTLYQPDNTQYSTSTINYPSGGWTDNSPINFAGTYGYNFAPGSTFATFPNPTDRISLAPIINNYNYYNWAALPTSNHQLTFYSVINSSLFGNPISVRGDEFFNESVDLEGGALQTFLLVNKSVAETYTTEENNNYNTGLPIYSVNESINYFSNQFDVVSIKDHPANLPQFKDSSAYIRFVNVTPAVSDQSVNQASETLDVYIAPLYGLRPDIVSIFGTTKFIDSVGPEMLVSKGLQRYQSTVDAPFYEINVAANMRINKTTGKPDTATVPGKPLVPRYYRVLAYRSGQSAATGDTPVAIGDWLAIYNEFPGYDQTNISGGGATGTNVVDSWLLRYDGANYHPAICTIAIAADMQIYQGPNGGNGVSFYLGFRSCINYQKAGINSVYFQ